jgi:hypothetical protein
MKRARNGKGCRAVVVSRPRHNSSSNSNSASSRSSGNKVARLAQSIRGRAAGSRKAGKEDNRDKLHRRGSNNILAQ